MWERNVGALTCNDGGRMVHSVVDSMERCVAEDISNAPMLSPGVLLYSGHDWTLMPLKMVLDCKHGSVDHEALHRTLTHVLTPTPTCTSTGCICPHWFTCRRPLRTSSSGACMRQI